MQLLQNLMLTALVLMLPLFQDAEAMPVSTQQPPTNGTNATDTTEPASRKNTSSLEDTTFHAQTQSLPETVALPLSAEPPQTELDSSTDLFSGSSTAMATASAVAASSSTTVVKHIARRKRETEVTMPFDFNTLHLPCDFDIGSRSNYVEYMPNHCIWTWNNKFTHEGFYRVFKTYQLEGFFFGQYYERLKRFEIDPHTWDYGEVGVD